MHGVAEVGSTANKYEILAKLATGGMAEIFLARGASVAGVERYVVLKRILRDRATDAHFVQMFLEEARLAAMLNHPNVAQVFDIGKLGESYFFTMEYVHGETVRNLLHRARSLRREIPLGCILTVIAATAAGLHHAHDRLGLDGRPLGIVHRDVSPSNLMISYEGSVKVVDFGVAKADNRAQETRSGAVKGKISYLSPEQISGINVDRRSDLFALGIVLWEMLTTERLYRRASDFENMNAIVNEPPEVPSRWRQNVPRELDEMAIRLLSKRPEDRYQSGDELVEAIEGLASRVGAQLSSAALGRFMRELFGQRPEPWHEVEFRDAAPDGVTVTNEPIPQELLAAIDPVELDLAQVRDLSRQHAAVGSASAAPGTPIPPRPSTDGFLADDLDTMKTLGVPRPVQSVDVMKTLQQNSPELYAAMHVQAEARPTLPMHGIRPPTVRMSPPPPNAIGTSGSIRRPPMVAIAPLVAPAPARAPAAKSQLGVVIAIAALVGVAATITAVTLMASEPTTTDGPLIANGPGSAAEAATSGTTTTAPPGTTTTTTRPATTGTTTTATTGTTPGMTTTGTNSPPGTTTTAPPGTTTTGTTGTMPATAPSEATDTTRPAPTGTTPPADTKKRPKTVAAAVPDEDNRSQGDKISAAFVAEEIDRVLALCRIDVDDRAHVCAIASCRGSDESRARGYLAKVTVPSKRAAAYAGCKDAGVELATPKIKTTTPTTTKPDPSKECANDPMACQH